MTILLGLIISSSWCMERDPNISHQPGQQLTDDRPGDSSDCEYEESKKSDSEDEYSFEKAAGQFETLTP